MYTQDKLRKESITIGCIPTQNDKYTLMHEDCSFALVVKGHFSTLCVLISLKANHGFLNKVSSK